MEKKGGMTREVVRDGGSFREVTTLYDETGNILHRIISPLRSEFRPKDVLQVLIGSAILAVPVGFTQETWELGAALPFLNVLGFMAISLLFIGAFVYYNYHRAAKIGDHFGEFAKRVAATYVISFLVVTIILMLIEQARWDLDWVTAFKITVVVAFPASMSAAVADTIK